MVYGRKELIFTVWNLERNVFFRKPLVEKLVFNTGELSVTYNLIPRRIQKQIEAATRNRRRRTF